ncbi:hypothetical protein [Morganella morganii]|uniref:Major facilitator superfamily (MFS) profile domain-containing protein n=1 Tax=bacterium 19GA11TI05 TaxID=2920688 RepID=A0AAU6TQM3_UNCXX
MNQQQRIALCVLVLAGFVTIFDLFVVNVAIVSIERGLQASFTELTLIIAGYIRPEWPFSHWRHCCVLPHRQLYYW